MNNETKLQIEKVKSNLTSLKEIQEYIELSKQVNESKILKSIEEELKKMQQELVHLLNDNESELYQQKLQEYKTLKENFDKNPLYSNYLETKEKVNDLLVQISDILSSL